jgi:hypothetical protein
VLLAEIQQVQKSSQKSSAETIKGIQFFADRLGLEFERYSGACIIEYHHALLCKLCMHLYLQ